MGDHRPALDVQTARLAPDLIPLINALLDDFHPYAVEEIGKHKRRVHFSSTRDRNGAARAVQGHFGSSGVTTVPVEVPDDGWAERSQTSLRAVRVGDVVVAPPWDIPRELPNTTLVIIRPSMGFGTGHHASTRLCLHALQQLEVTHRTVVDLGTGSGVLAIAAAKLGAASVVAVERDTDALATARDHVALNGASIVALRHCDVRDTDDLPRASIVLANLTAALLRARAATLLRCATPGGVIGAGGVTTPEEASVRRAFAPDAAVVARAVEDEWVVLTLRTSTAGSRRSTDVHPPRLRPRGE